MGDILFTAVAIAGFGIAIWQNVALSRGAPRREAAIWLGAAAILGVAGLQRVVFTIRSSMGEGLDLALGFQIMLIANPVVVAVVLTVIRPVLQNYRIAERKLRASEEAFMRSLANSRDPVAIIDGIGRCIYVNDAGITLFRSTREEILGRHFREFITGDNADSSDGVTVQSEREVLRGDGSRVTVDLDLIALGDGRTLIVGRDLTPRREAEALRLQAERLGTVRRLGASVTADFTDTLTFVKSSLELTAEFGDDRVPVEAPIAATDHALTLIREFSLLTDETVEGDDLPRPAIDIRPVVREAVLAAAEHLDERAQLECFDLPAPVMVRATAEDISRICTGLLANAIAAIDEALSAAPPSGGFIGKVALQIWPAAQSSSGATTDVEIVVDDNGGALDPDVRAHMFDPLLSNLSRRIGLGATHALVLHLGGSMTVLRWPEGGGMASVRLPGLETPTPESAKVPSIVTNSE